MHRHTQVVVSGLLGAMLLAALVGCSNPGTSGNTNGGANQNTGGGTINGGDGTTSPGGPAGSGSGMMGRGGSAGSYSSVGQAIFLTGVGTDGRRISSTAANVSQGSLMMGGGGCGSCHGANGRGGTIRMMNGNAVKVPDVTYDALIKAGFTDATIQRAIHDGLDETGKPLHAVMPRWQMSGADLDATVAYLKVLSRQ